MITTCTGPIELEFVINIASKAANTQDNLILFLKSFWTQPNLNIYLPVLLIISFIGEVSFNCV